MTISRALLRAPRVGAREFRNKACSFIRAGKLCLVTEHGKLKGVFMPYDDALELADIIDELNDKELVRTIAEGRRAVRRGVRGVALRESVRRRRFHV
jgi:hypothetical protein